MTFVRRHEGALLLTLFALFLAVNLVTGARSPTVWTDEVAYADPAVNLVQNGTFTSTAWEAQMGDEHWAGNVPLYQWLLSGWLTVFGVSITAVRAIGYVLAILGAAMLWVALRRLGWVQTPEARLLVVLVILTGYGVTYGYRAGRPDILGFVLFSTAAWGWTLRPPLRYGTLALVGLALPWAGLQFLPFAALAVAVGLIAAPGPFLRAGAAGGSGGLAGAGLLYAYYQHHGVWGDFLVSITRHTAAEQGLAAKLTGLPALPLVDPSYAALLVGLALLWMFKGGAREAFRRPEVRYPVLLALLVPLALFVTGKYPTYYTWMAYVPLVVGAGAWTSPLTWSRGSLAAAGLIVGTACLIGLPARVGVSILQWDGRSYAPVRALVEEHVAPSDTVFAWYEGYYAVKGRAAAVYLPKYLWRPVPAKTPQLQSVDKIVTPPRYAAPVARLLGDRWERLGRTQAGERAVTQFLGRALAEPYDVAVYVRRDSSKAGDR